MKNISRIYNIGASVNQIGLVPNDGDLPGGLVLEKIKVYPC